MALTAELKERIVMALVAAEGRVEQCRFTLARGEARCAVGVILESIYGIEFEDEEAYIPKGKPGPWWQPGAEQFWNDVPAGLQSAIANANNSGSSFDTIARMVKEWECEGGAGE